MLVKARWASPIHYFCRCVGRVDRYLAARACEELCDAVRLFRAPQRLSKRPVFDGLPKWALVRCYTLRYASVEWLRSPQNVILVCAQKPVLQAL